MLIVFIKGYVGNLGTKILIDEKRKELDNYFSKAFIDDLNSKLNELIDIEDGAIPSLYMQKIVDREKISIGGVLAALWKLCDRNRWGIEYSLNNIPMIQGVIEVSNYYDLNPYRLLTENAELIVVDDDINSKSNNISFYDDVYANDLFKEIGVIINGKKRVRVDGENETYLTKDFKDEIDKILFNYTRRMKKTIE